MRKLMACLVALAVAGAANAVTIRPGFNSSSLAANDDGSTGLVGIGFTTNFFGFSSNSLYVNNNGNVTFTAPLGTFTPFNLNTTATRIIAPFFADVDTRGAGSNIVRYGAGTVDGRAAFGVNWVDVGYFSNGTDRLNDFQLIVIDRGDTGAGNFDFEFNYGDILWETGSASGGSGGLGGNSARAGFSNGAGTSFELTGSAVNGAFLNGGPNQLRTGSNIGVPGRFLFSVRNGVVQATPVPEPISLLVFGGLLAGGGLVARKRLITKAAA